VPLRGRTDTPTASAGRPARQSNAPPRRLRSPA
jgi:hypothetical protein